ncbi:MAG: antibiotic biosynthesis monooxygenase [Polyangiaceae bacterium]|jgi:quinol monooxygenase YgiN|nr:antibiotic biosynthesis monooxygenase [Polyangiaceae bacterium]
MIVEYIRYEVSDAEALVRAYESGRSALDASPHCLAYELSRCTEEPKSVVVRIEWDSAEGHLQGFRKSPEFAGFLAAVRPFIEHIREMRHYEVSGVSRRKVTP